MVIYAIRTTVGREESVVDNLAAVVRRKGYHVYSVVFPKEFKGYVLVEADSLSTIEIAIKGVNHARGIVRSPVPLEDIQQSLTAKSATIKIDKNDIVELVAGPFKGERARISRVDKTKREVTVELVEAAVPIPVTVAIESVRLVQHAEQKAIGE